MRLEHQFQRVAERLGERVRSAGRGGRGTGDEEVRLGALQRALRAVHPVERVDDAVQPLLGGDEPSRPVAFFGRVAEIDGSRREIDRPAARGAHAERRLVERRQFAGQLEVAVVVAVVAEGKVDVDDVIGAGDERRRLHPGVVAAGGRGRGQRREQRGEQGNRSGHRRLLHGAEDRGAARAAPPWDTMLTNRPSRARRR